MNMNSNNIGNKISIARKKLKKNQKSLAEFCGVSQGVVSDWEKGKKKPKIENIKKIAEYLNVSPADLRDIEDEVLYTEKELQFLNLIDKKASVELTDAQIIDMFNFSIDGHAASEEEIRGAIAYIRTLRSTR